MNFLKNFERNRNPAGRLNCMGFGMCQIADGLVRMLSFGFCHSRFTIDYARNTALARLNKLKADRDTQ